jgi:hypothetical protein
LSSWIATSPSSTSERLTEKVREVFAAKPACPFDRRPDPWRHA